VFLLNEMALEGDTQDDAQVEEQAHGLLLLLTTMADGRCHSREEACGNGASHFFLFTADGGEVSRTGCGGMCLIRWELIGWLLPFLVMSQHILAVQKLILRSLFFSQCGKSDGAQMQPAFI
jgi:hypothetical protein